MSSPDVYAGIAAEADAAPQGDAYQGIGAAAPAPYVAPDTNTTPLKNNPLSGMSFLQNLAYGDKETVDNAATAAKEWWARLTGNQPMLQQAQSKAQSDRQLYQPVSSSVGGKVGQAAIPVGAAFIPGLDTWAGAAGLGALSGAASPTVQGESPYLAPAIGAALGVAGKGIGDAASNWLTERAAQPFMGWNPATANRTAAAAIGSDAPAPTQEVIGAANKRIGDIFNQARSPNVTAAVGDDTLTALDQVGNGLNTSSRKSLLQNDSVRDLIAHLGETPTAQQLGSISSNLGKDAASQMMSKDGDRALGSALFSLKDHVDDLVGSTIQDPALSAAYSAARGQYRALQQITANPSIFNSATGDVNMTALGKYLQRSDKPGYMRGGNKSDLYNAARWGQAEGVGKGAPEFSVENLGIPFAKYYALNNPLSRALGGAVSRAGAPVSPLVQRGLMGGGAASTTLGWPQGLIQ